MSRSDSDNSVDNRPPDDLGRYDRQMRFAPVGTEGQRKLLDSRVLICGCGALGSVSAELLARAGVGHLRLVDRDFLELNNLQRQTLYDEADVAAGLPKAEAAARKLRAINSQIEVEPLVTDLRHQNVLELFRDCDVVIDGTDNFETRFLINDAAIKTQVPWVFAGCLGADGQTMTVLPQQSACLSCLMPEGPPAVGSTPTCDSAGILAPIIQVMAAIQAAEAMKILCGHREQVSPFLTVIGLWDNQMRQMKTSGLREQGDCPTCRRQQFDWLEGKRGSQSTILCGRNAVQVRMDDVARLDLDRVAAQFREDDITLHNRFLLRVRVDNLQLTLFPDGRAIVNGTEDLSRAKTILARYVGQ